MTTCRVCGRELTDPESVRLGIGPECLHKEVPPMSKAVEVRLPDGVIEAMNGAALPATATTVLRREGASMPYTTRGLKELLERLSVEAAIYEMSQRLEAVRGEVSTVEDSRKALVRMQEENRRLTADVQELRSELQRLAAAPAMAVSAVD